MKTLIPLRMYSFFKNHLNAALFLFCMVTSCQITPELPDASPPEISWILSVAGESEVRELEMPNSSVRIPAGTSYTAYAIIVDLESGIQRTYDAPVSSKTCCDRENSLCAQTAPLVANRVSEFPLNSEGQALDRVILSDENRAVSCTSAQFPVLTGGSIAYQVRAINHDDKESRGTLSIISSVE